MTDLAPGGAAVSRRIRTFTAPAWVITFGVPLLFALIGLAIRYAAYSMSVQGPSLVHFDDGLCRWDCGWYMKIATVGYDPFPILTQETRTAGNWAFFPLYPVLIGFLKSGLGGHTMLVATAVSLLLSGATAILARPLLQTNRAFVLFSAYLLSGPFSVYFTTFMTEVLFIFLSVLVLICLEKRSYVQAGLAAGLLSATRIVGVFMSLALLVQAFIDHRAAGGRLSGFIPALLRRPDILLGLVLAPLGCSVYVLFLYGWMGDGLAFMHTQRAWGRTSGNPFVFVWRALTSWPTDSLVPTSSQQLAVATIFGFVIVGVLIWKRHFAEAVFGFLCLFTPLFAGMASILRFTAALAPVVLETMRLLSINRWVWAASLLGFLVADYFVTTQWIGGALSLV